MDFQVDPEFLKALQAAAECDPRKWIGHEVDCMGTKYEVAEFLGMGKNSVAFRMRHKAGEKPDLVMKLPAFDFDPNYRLEKIMREEVFRKPMDARRLLAVCEKKLSLFPGDPPAAFNKALALYILKAFEEAVEACDVAISIENDIWNWLLKSACQAARRNDSECLACLQKAGELDPEETRKGLGMWGIKNVIEEALDRLMDSRNNAGAASDALRQFLE